VTDAPALVRLTRRQFLARGTYAYATAGAALSAYGIWSAYRLPVITRRTLSFPDLPDGLLNVRDERAAGEGFGGFAEGGKRRAGSFADPPPHPYRLLDHVTVIMLQEPDQGRHGGLRGGTEVAQDRTRRATSEPVRVLEERDERREEEARLGSQGG